MLMQIFQSTLPMRGVTKEMKADQQRHYISIHTPHAGSDAEENSDDYDIKISIHTPHAGSDIKPPVRKV